MKDPNAKECMRVRLVSMVDDPNPVTAGTEGTIRLVDDMGTIHVRWDDGRTLGLIPGVDDYILQPSIGDFFDEIHEASFDKAIKNSNTSKNFKGTKGVKIEAHTSYDELIEVKDKIKGGKADKLSIKDLSKKHKVSVDDIKKEIRIGVKIEKEHKNTIEYLKNNPNVSILDAAKKIAMDHISEFSDYYSNKRYGVLASEKGLKKTEKKSKKKDDTDYMTSTGSVGGVNGMGYIKASAWGAGVFAPKKRKKKKKSKLENVTTKGELLKSVNEVTATYTNNNGTLVKKNHDDTKLEAWADKNNDGWNWNDEPIWEGGEIVEPLASIKTAWDNDNLDVSKEWDKVQNKKLKKEDLIHLIKTRIVETKKGVNIDIEKGDTILTGKFKNHKDKVKSIGKDDKNQPTVNKKPMLKFKVPKLNPKEGEEKELDETTTFGSVWAQNGPPVGPAFAAKAGQWNMIKRPIWKGGTIIQKDIENSILNPLTEVNNVKYNPEGKIVKIKKKCTKFPYCNQGAIDNPLEVSDTVKGDGSYVQEVVLSDETIKNIHEISKQTGKSFTEVYRTVKKSVSK